MLDATGGQASTMAVAKAQALISQNAVVVFRSVVVLFPWFYNCWFGMWWCCGVQFVWSFEVPCGVVNMISTVKLIAMFVSAVFVLIVIHCSTFVFVLVDIW